MFNEGLKFNDKLNTFRVNYCFAQQIRPSCKVGISNELLLIVVLSSLLKAIQGGIIAWKLPLDPLITPGNAIESFIVYPNPVTERISTLDLVYAQEIKASRKISLPSSQRSKILTLLPSYSSGSEDIGPILNILALILQQNLNLEDGNRVYAASGISFPTELGFEPILYSLQAWSCFQPAWQHHLSQQKIISR